MSQSVNNLFQSAQTMGLLSGQSVQALTGITDIGAQIQAGLGIPADQIQASEVTLVSLMPDDSGSIRMAGNAHLVRDGHNLTVEALRGTKQEKGTLLLTRYLNGFVLNDYQPVDQAQLMDPNNYNPNLGTPLYDQTIVLLGTVLAKTQDYLDNGLPTRSITVIITDGADCSSRKQAKDVAPIVRDMLRAENHIIAGIGIDDGSTDFRKVFQDMGFLDEWILTPKTKEELRKAFMLVSQSAVRASQGAGSFSQTAMGGFGTP